MSINAEWFEQSTASYSLDWNTAMLLHRSNAEQTLW